MAKTALYRTIWRWHFYAGLFVIPFILLLSVTGSIYLFKPQIDRWEERDWRGLPTAQAVTPDQQLQAALAAVPGGTFNHYRLPSQAGDAAVIHLALADHSMRDVAVSPAGKVIAIVDPTSRISPTISRIHGSLLMGLAGGLLVELAASWAIVMILSGLYLWWPRGRGLTGVLWPRWRGGQRLFWRDLHAVTGFWVAGLALVSLASGLPWSDAWATGFRLVRAEMGWIDGPQTWKGGVDLHASHDHQAMMDHHSMAAPAPTISLTAIAAKAMAENMPFPAIIQPPFAAARFGPPNGNVWRLTSEAQNRPLIRTVTYDPMTGAETSRSDFSDKHVIDRVINYGIAWHEGQLFGPINQAVGVLTALALISLAVSGSIMWWRRRPQGTLGAPPMPTDSRMKGLIILLCGLAALLPMLLLSLVVVGLLDWLIIRRSKPLARWLGTVRE
jgi:uncharacterized iron-regulated membrane protein